MGKDLQTRLGTTANPGGANARVHQNLDQPLATPSV